MEAKIHGSNPPESLSVTFLLYYSAIDGAGENQLVWYRWPLALYSLQIARPSGSIAYMAP